jgi:pimeloyl-ACP methyl ester carboxylesterase
MTEKRIHLSGVDLNYVEAGTGQAMLFLHNGGGFWQSWRFQLEYFSQHYRVFGIDWPGFGGSSQPEELVTVSYLTDILEEFIIKLNLNNPILIGNCIGASVALQYNLRYPQSVRSLILFNPCPGDLIFPFPPMRWLVKRVHKSNRLQQKLKPFFIFLFNKTWFSRQFPKILFGKNYNPTSELFQRYIDKLKEQKQTDARVNLLYAVPTFNMELITQSYEIPEHLLVWGKENKVSLLKSHGTIHKRLLQNQHVKIIDKSGHLCMYELPDEVNQTIASYLQQML